MRRFHRANGGDAEQHFMVLLSCISLSHSCQAPCLRLSRRRPSLFVVPCVCMHGGVLPTYGAVVLQYTLYQRRYTLF